MALRRRQNVEAADRALRLRNRRLQQPHQPPRQRLHARAIEQVGPIVEPQLQPLARHRHQAQRIMRGIVPADVGKPQTASLAARPARSTG